MIIFKLSMVLKGQAAATLDATRDNMWRDTPHMIVSSSIVVVGKCRWRQVGTGRRVIIEGCSSSRMEMGGRIYHHPYCYYYSNK